MREKKIMNVGMATFHKASTFDLHLPKKARKREHFGFRGAPHLSPLPPNVTLSGYLFTIFKIAMVSEFALVVSCGTSVINAILAKQ
jgi:hypothetical protein